MSDAPVHELLREGCLDAAGAQCQRKLQRDSRDSATRWMLATLYCFQSDFERADKQLDTLAGLDETWSSSAVAFRGLLRAAAWRRDVFDRGRVPDFCGPPPVLLQEALSALVDLRAGDAQAAAVRLQAIEQSRSATPGAVDGGPFTEWRDLDDLCASFLEVFLPGGIYAWIAWENIASLEFQPVVRTRDTLWRPVSLSIVGGPSGTAHIPCLYEGTIRATSGLLKLGAETDWLTDKFGIVRGVGQRMFAADAREPAICEITSVRFDSPRPLPGVGDA